MRYAPRGIRANASGPTRCRLSGVARACSEMSRDRLSNSSSLTMVTPGGITGGGTGS